MFFGYPIEATQFNWFHECLRQMIEDIHQRKTNNSPKATWPEMIPVEHKAKLKRKTGIKDRILKYQDALRPLSDEDFQKVRIAFENQVCIPELLNCERDCGCVQDLPESIRKPLKNLFSFCFEKLTDLEVRDQQYKAVYGHLKSKICPFCGNENFDAPGAPREHLDHYLAESLYPFAATHLRNLVPMGASCNSKYKKNADVLRKNGTRRKAIDPYNHNKVVVCLDRSEPFAGRNGKFPRWEIDLIGDDVEKVETWNDVFHIKERFERDILDAKYDTWMMDFSGYCKPYCNQDENEALTFLENYVESLKVTPMTTGSLLKTATFEMILKKCKDGNDRLIDQIKNAFVQYRKPA